MTEDKVKKLILKIIENIENISEWTGVEDFQPIGSYFFLKEEIHILSKTEVIQKNLKESLQDSLAETSVEKILENHSIENYTKQFARLMPF